MTVLEGTSCFKPVRAIAAFSTAALEQVFRLSPEMRLRWRPCRAVLLCRLVHCCGPALALD
jgi:hypothetical protein